MGYALLLVYTLLIFVRPMEWVPGLLGVPILDFVVAATLLGWLVALSSKTSFRPLAAPHGWLVLGFFVATLMSHVSHGYLSAFQYTFESFGKVVLLYYLVATLLTTRTRLRGLVAAMVVGCLFMSLHGILQIHRGAGFAGMLPMYYPVSYTHLRAHET